MRQIFENVWEVDIRRKNMWFQRKSRTERRKFPRIILLILLACLMFVKLCEGLLSVSRLVAPWSAPQRMMSAPKETIGLQNTWADLWFFLLFSPHLCVGFLFLVVHSRLPPPASRRLPHSTYSHTTYPHTTCQHTTCSHTTCSHTTYSHTTFSHTQLAHTQLTRTQPTHKT